MNQLINDNSWEGLRYEGQYDDNGVARVVLFQNGITNQNEKEISSLRDYWLSGLVEKLRCYKKNLMGIYYYQFKYKGGSALQTHLKNLSMKSNHPFYESGGRAVNKTMLELPQLLSFIVLRDPVERIKSNSFHNDIIQDVNIQNTSILDNHYIKSLIAWQGVDPIGELELQNAKEILQSFDLVLIEEWMHWPSSLSANHPLFKQLNRTTTTTTATTITTATTPNHLNDRKPQNFLHNEAETGRFVVRNSFDIRLYLFAQSLVRDRFHALVHQKQQLRREWKQCPLLSKI
eukprot:CAMPEP_0170084150 /NCGR_PEP_ID=MMETSP0019_2-20121128/19435_1 /TAXON_ID=98059 /ORGANISM="Dinobryon sp., Strain UTEXLB2267" /LENGTH=288 /DNA_ID=CAMNT_0010300127 /DNA_START=106 /DNA_END=972 /DNA_ORIENTATION=+